MQPSQTTPESSSQPSRADEMAADAAAIFRRVLVPVDFTMDSQRAFGVALALQHRYDAAVCIFHSAESAGSDDWLGGIGSPSVGGDWVAEAEGRMQRFIRNVAPAEVGRIDVRARVGEPLHTLPKVVEEWKATLVVAAAAFHRRFFRSAAERLLREVHVPMLIIPATEV